MNLFWFYIYKRILILLFIIIIYLTIVFLQSLASILQT